VRHALPLVILILVLAGSSARAHHSHPDFLLDHKVSVEGTLEALTYANPHVVLRIRTAQGVLYTAEWQAASWLQYHAHVTLTTLRVGDHVIISGAPSRDPASHELVRLQEVRRPSDGWAYQVIPEGSAALSPKH
jgi:hypothetical protein